jgi:hypothetical protein
MKPNTGFNADVDKAGAGQPERYLVSIRNHQS